MRNKILSMLLNNRGEYISGEEISNLLGVSRTAIWKYIQTLKNEGYQIASSSKKGYSLVGTPDLLDPILIREAMDTTVIGRDIRYYASIESTNTTAKELVAEGAPEGTVVLAEEQRSGKGRLGRSWVSPRGSGIWMSVILKPEIKPSDAPKITMIGAIAVAETIEDLTGLKTGIKWPNDIIIGKKKTCGILTEMSADMDEIHWVILGIGVNVNLTSEDFPEEIQATATSLQIETSHHVSRIELVRGICERLELLYQKFVSEDGWEEIIDQSRKRSVTLGKKVRVIGPGTDFIGIAREMDDEGALLVQREDGTTERVISGDVSVRGMQGYV